MKPLKRLFTHAEVKGVARILEKYGYMLFRGKFYAVTILGKEALDVLSASGDEKKLIYWCMVLKAMNREINTEQCLSCSEDDLELMESLNILDAYTVRKIQKYRNPSVGTIKKTSKVEECSICYTEQ